MGTPSGSKNNNILQDRLEYLARNFEERGDDPAIEKEFHKSVDSTGYAMEKELKQKELQEFLAAKSGVKFEQSLKRLDSIASNRSSASVGPRQQQKRQLPSFVKLRSKEVEESLPPEKKSKLDAEASVEAALSAAEAHDASTKAERMGGLLGYASDSDEGDSDEEDA
mmetsp:Transcript_13953/g.25759  ORF Transcript_13953/g.25759 Transcript_13953/m.25759 type:complete len:167 (+) Transcript_13953:65-565(+)